MERVPVRRNSTASELLSDLDKEIWLDRFRQKARGTNAPGSISRCCRQLERAIVALCTASQEPKMAALPVRELLTALGRCELAMANSIDWTRESGLRPIPLLSPLWLSIGAQADDPSLVEYRLAAALASLALTGYFGEQSHPFRSHLEPVELGGPREQRWARWATQEDRNVIGTDGRLTDRFNEIVHRRILLCEQTGKQGWQEFSAVTAHPSDIAAFIEGTCDDGLLRDFLAGLSLVNWADPDIKVPRAPANDLLPDAFYALLKLCHSKPPTKDAPVVPLDAAIHRFAATGNADRAAALAIRRLRSSGVRIGISELHGLFGATERAAAAVLFPLWPNQLRQVASIIHIDHDEPYSSEPLSTSIQTETTL